MSFFLSEYAALQLLRQDGTCVRARDALSPHAYVLVYFASHSVPSCQRLTLDLADFFVAHARRHAFTVLFVSHDRCERYMLDFFQNKRPVYVPHTRSCVAASTTTSLSPSQQQQAQPRQEQHSSPTRNVADTTTPSRARGHADWLALPFAERAVARALQRRYRVSSVPALVLVDVATSRVLTCTAAAHLRSDPCALHFPWHDDDGGDKKMTRMTRARAQRLARGVMLHLRYIVLVVVALSLILLLALRARRRAQDGT